MKDSVIFIGSPEAAATKQRDQLRNYSKLFVVSPKDFVGRIWASFMPPFNRYRKVFVDLLGLFVSFFGLLLFLNYGYSLKPHKINVSPFESLVCFSVITPIISFILLRVGRSRVTFLETLSVFGYSLFGHLFTLLVSFIFFQETSNAVFFICLIFIGGPSTLRLILVYLKTIPAPAARLLICSTVSLGNILFLIYLHFAFMHKNYTYRRNVQ